MLVLVSKLDQEDEDLRRVVAGVDGISVHSYRFPKPGMYDSEALDSVRQQFHAAGWKRMVSTHDKTGGSGATDLWIHFENKTIRNVAVLFAGEKQLNLIAVSGSISPLDLFSSQRTLRHPQDRRRSSCACAGQRPVTGEVKPDLLGLRPLKHGPYTLKTKSAGWPTN